MNYLDAAIRFNQRCPKGSAVEIALRSGELLITKTAAPAFVWADLALVELEGAKGPYQVEHVRLLAERALPANASHVTQADPKVA
jgi:hypothetical protein